MLFLCQFWYVYIVFNSNLGICHSINLPLVFTKQEEQSFLIHCPFSCLLYTIIRLPHKSPISSRYVLFLCQFWYVYIVLNSNLGICYSITLPLVFTKQEEQSFLIHYPFSCLLYTIIRLPPKSPISSRYVLFLCQFLYVYIVLNNNLGICYSINPLFVS